MLLSIEKKIKQSPDLPDDESLQSDDSEFGWEPSDEDPTILKVEPEDHSPSKGTETEKIMRNVCFYLEKSRKRKSKSTGKGPTKKKKKK